MFLQLAAVDASIGSAHHPRQLEERLHVSLTNEAPAHRTRVKCKPTRHITTQRVVKTPSSFGHRGVLRQGRACQHQEGSTERMRTNEIDRTAPASDSLGTQNCLVNARNPIRVIRVLS